MARKEWYDIPLDGTEESLEGYSGERVGDLILGKVGYLYREGDWVYGFKSESAYNKWEEDQRSEESTEKYLLTQVNISSGTNTVLAFENPNSGAPIRATDGVLNITFKCNYYNSNNGSIEPIDNSANISLYARSFGASSWGSPLITYYCATNVEYTRDIYNLLGNLSGHIQIQLRTNIDGRSATKTFTNVYKSNMHISYNAEWDKSFSAENPLQFNLTDYENAALHYKIDNGSEVTSSITLSNTVSLNFSNLSSGVHTLEIWLEREITEEGTTILEESNHLNFQFLWNGNASTPYLIVNDVVSELINFSSIVLFKYYIANGDSSINYPVSITWGDGNTHNLATINYTDNHIHTYSSAIVIPNLNGTNEAVLHIGNHSFTIQLVGSEYTVSTPDFHWDSSNFDDISKTTTVIGNSKDGVIDDSGTRLYRVLKGQRCILPNSNTPFYRNNNQVNSVFEICFKAHHVVGNSPIVKVASSASNGLFIEPSRAYYITSTTSDPLNRDVLFGFPRNNGTDDWVTLTVVLDYNYNNSGKGLVFIYVNGCINRIATLSGSNLGQIELGSDESDVDIKYIRYTQNTVLSSTQIFRNYILQSGLNNINEIITSNNILDVDNEVNFDLVHNQGYNCLVWIKTNTIEAPPLPCLATGATTADFKSGRFKNFTGKLHIYEGNELKGDLSGKITYQGTSSATYHKWNYKFTIEEDGTYQLDDTTPPANQLTWKLNWASSMQSHKIGATALYNDLQKALCYTGNDRPYRVAIKQKPYFLFTKTSEDATPVFYGLVTFGPHKGDAQTFGYVRDDSGMMLEGSNNESLLARHLIPWDTNIIVDDDEVKVADSYKGSGASIPSKEWEIDFGSEYTSKDTLISKFKNAYNFIYNHSLDIGVLNESSSNYIGTNTDEPTQKHHLYLTNDEKLIRYDSYLLKWVNAGDEYDSSTQTFSELTYSDEVESGSASSLSGKKDEIINARKASFMGNLNSDTDSSDVFNLQGDVTGGIWDYFDAKDLIFTMNFCLFIAASDNRSKNTYIYTIYENDGYSKLRFAQDDLDTIFAVNNRGTLNKPFWQEIHDTNSNTNGLLPPTAEWASMDNVLYNTVEECYPNILRNGMAALLRETAKLGNGSTLSVYDTMHQYFLSVQEYFPKIAYNKCQELLYINAYLDNTYGAGKQAEALTQALGDQYLAEKEWIKNRVEYIGGYAKYGKDLFSIDNTNEYSLLPEGEIDKISAAGSGNNIVLTFKVRNDRYTYPSFYTSSGKNSLSRTSPESTINLTIGTVTGTASYGFTGIENYSEVSNIGTISSNSEISINGRFLSAITVNASSGYSWNLNAPVNFNTSSPSTIIINKSDYAASPVLTSLDHATTINLSSSSIESVSIPASNVLTTLNLPTSVRVLNINDVPNLITLSTATDTLNNIQNLDIGTENTVVHTKVLNIIENNSLQSLHIEKVKWDLYTNTFSNVSVFLKNLLDISSLIIDSGYIDFHNIVIKTIEKIKILDKLRSITIRHTINTDSLDIVGRVVNISTSSYYSISGTSTYNDFDTIQWTSNIGSMDDSNYLYRNLLQNINSDTLNPYITVDLYKNDDLVKSATLYITAIAGYNPVVGDFIYRDSDNTEYIVSPVRLDSELNIGIGQVFYVEGNQYYIVTLAPTSVLKQWGPSDPYVQNNPSSDLYNTIYNALGSEASNYTTYFNSGNLKVKGNDVDASNNSLGGSIGTGKTYTDNIINAAVFLASNLQNDSYTTNEGVIITKELLGYPAAKYCAEYKAFSGDTLNWWLGSAKEMKTLLTSGIDSIPSVNRVWTSTQRSGASSNSNATVVISSGTAYVAGDTFSSYSSTSLNVLPITKVQL